MTEKKIIKSDNGNKIIKDAMLTLEGALIPKDVKPSFLKLIMPMKIVLILMEKFTGSIFYPTTSEEQISIEI